MLIYLHLPFCHRICPYCSFYKHTPGATPIPRLIDALHRELDQRLASRTLPPTAARAHSLYLGGGTPSMLSPAHLRRLFAGLRARLPWDALRETTLEANPATFDGAKATLFRELGVRRVSLGIQSFAPHVLQTLGREHDPDQARQAVRLLRQAGMPSINIDLMFSVPGLTLADWRATLQTAIQLEPDHISAYNLTYEEDTAFFESLRQGQLDQCEDRDAEQFHLAHELLTTAGYEHYETSNYARPGHRSLHNQGYWEGRDYLGLGPSAVSTLTTDRGATRSTNVADTARYTAMVEALGHAIVEEETLTPAQWKIERLALLLRTDRGIPRAWADAPATRALVAEGLAELKGERLVLTRTGSALVDPIAAELA